jgi:hypothetical protein
VRADSFGLSNENRCPVIGRAGSIPAFSEFLRNGEIGRHDDNDAIANHLFALQVKRI